MNALVNLNMTKRDDGKWLCEGPYALVGIGNSGKMAERDLHRKVERMKDEIERWTGHRLSLC